MNNEKHFFNLKPFLKVSSLIFVLVISFLIINKIYSDEYDEKTTSFVDGELKSYREAIRLMDMKADSFSIVYNNMLKESCLPVMDMKFKADYLGSFDKYAFKRDKYHLFKCTQSYGICRFTDSVNGSAEGILFHPYNPDLYVPISISILGNEYFGNVRGFNGKFRIKMRKS